MPYRVTRGPDTFQQTMNYILAPLLRKGVVVFIDDILIYTNTWDHHLTILHSVFQLLVQHQIKIKLSKYSSARVSADLRKLRMCRISLPYFCKKCRQKRTNIVIRRLVEDAALVTLYSNIVFLHSSHTTRGRSGLSHSWTPCEAEDLDLDAI